MTILYWVLIAILVIGCLFGLKSLINFVILSWAENDGRFALLFVIFIILITAPGIVKMFYPKLYGISIWVFILYSLSLIAYKNLSSKKEEEG